MEEFFNQIRERYLSLSEDEKDVLRSMVGTEQGRILSKILGPDIMSRIRPKQPTNMATQRRGLATR